MTADLPSPGPHQTGLATPLDRDARPNTAPPLGYCLLALESLQLLGIAAGDAGRSHLLAHVEGQLCIRFGSRSILQAYPTDGFVIALHGTDRDTALQELKLFVHELPLQGIMIGGHNFSVTGHAGVVWAAPGHANNGQDGVLRQLRIAAELARTAGGVVVLSAADPECESKHPIALMSELLCGLPAALGEGRLLLHVQEIVSCPLQDDARGGGKGEYEVLVQLRGSDGHVYPPADFLGGAERSFLIEMLDRVVFSDVLVKHAPMLRSHPGLSLSLNISARSLCNPGFAAFLAGLFERGGIAPERVQIEITETSAIRDIEQAQATVAAARAMGCRIALDDFGVGLSGYGYLKAFRPDCIKIDGALIPDVVDTQSPDALIVRSIISLAHSMGIQVVAEHVSSTEIHSALLALGVDKVQGHLFGRPEPLNCLIARLAT